LVLDISRGGDDELWWMIRASVKVLQRSHAEVPNSISCSEDRMPVWMRAPQRLVVQLEHEIVRRVLDHPNFLEHDLPLQGEIGRAQEWVKNDVGDDIRGL